LYGEVHHLKKFLIRLLLFEEARNEDTRESLKKSKKVKKEKSKKVKKKKKK
jgi:hypothetical protein